MVTSPGSIKGVNARVSGSAAHLWQHDELPGRGQRRNRNLDQAGAIAAGERTLEGGPQLGGVAGTLGCGSEALGEAHEIRVAEVAGDDAVVKALLLVAPHVAIGAVVEDHDRERDAVVNSGRHL